MLTPRIRNSWKELVSAKKAHGTVLLNGKKYWILQATHSAKKEQEGFGEWVVTDDPEGRGELRIFKISWLKGHPTVQTIIRERMERELEEKLERKGN
jgi:hypothetical protein